VLDPGIRGVPGRRAQLAEGIVELLRADEAQDLGRRLLAERAADLLSLPGLSVTGIGGGRGLQLTDGRLAFGGDLRNRALAERVEEGDRAGIVALRGQLPGA